MKRLPTAPADTPAEAHDDESELIGLSEINFILVIALLVTVSATVAQTGPDAGEAPEHGSATVRLDQSPVIDAPPPPTELAQGAGGFQPTHRVIAAGDTAEGPVVIAVPPDFPLDDIRLLIERAP